METQKSNFKILMVEDDTFLSDLLTKTLRKDGFDVVLTMDCQKGLDLAKSEKPHLILVDYILPGMSGADMVVRLKSDPELAAIPVIMLSNVGNKDEVRRVLSLGVKRFLVKYDTSLKKIGEEIMEVLNFKPRAD